MSKQKRAGTKIIFGGTLTCPECETPNLEITEESNTFECNLCGSIWNRLSPTISNNGKMTNLPDKLK